MRIILAGFLGIHEQEVSVEKYASYQAYYDQVWSALKLGHPSEADTMDNVDDEHIQIVVRLISEECCNTRSCWRGPLRENVRRKSLFDGHSDDSINRTIDLTLRLWLVLHIRDDEYVWGANSIQWDDDRTLQIFIASQFPESRPMKDLGERYFDLLLPENFTVVKLKRWSGIKFEWTYNFSEHLNFDKDHRVVKIFPLKSYMHGLRKSKVELIPNAVIDEYIKTMNMLFPSWDMKTQEYLKKKKQTFGMEPPVDYPGTLYLSDFCVWQSRLATIYAEFCSPPPSMTQLFNDRRNVLQWYTFWFAVMILILTVVFGVISSVFGGIQTRFAYLSLQLAREAGASGSVCTCGMLSAVVERTNS
ncbi:hypothetical protein BGZ60DRAFT_438333 [Tricladium varicosporioides]|nr:hypothetical protein BGZ60DRAFT_438333 [Hymenoscyphus varicosporioides]